jgi:hypothetical protein
MIAVAGRSSRTSFGPCQVGSAIRADEFSDATLKMKQVPFSILDLISSAAFVQTQTSQTIQTKWIENEARAQRTSPTLIRSVLLILDTKLASSFSIGKR